LLLNDPLQVISLIPRVHSYGIMRHLARAHYVVLRSQLLIVQIPARLQALRPTAENLA
jgi:hypothetical protein